ncbi:RNase H-like domain-containing protein, partial [Acinetobacter baumannii]|uniref:RNase H-like domain-containing protein n=1 Tax=Acinetobacter baumannii TaxID=470 RepID=UPI0033996D29
MTSAPVLHLPDLTQPFVLRTDASDLGLGAVLLQRDPKNAETLFPVAYASRKLRPAETHYATSEKECLGLVWAIQKFQLYLYGTHFTVQVDHQPLSFLAASKSLNSRLMRWALTL